MNPTLDTAANGHLTLSFNELSDACWLLLAENLIKLRGFKRLGSPVISIDEKIHQNFQCAEFSLAAGWDNWSGHYLLSNSVVGDVFLQKLFDQLLTGDSSHSLRLLGMRAWAFGNVCNGSVRACLDHNKTAKKQMLDYEAVKSRIFTKRRSEEHTSELQSQSNLVCR